MVNDSTRRDLNREMLGILADVGLAVAPGGIGLFTRLLRGESLFGGGMDLVLAARQRQWAMLDSNLAYNVSPTSWDKYATIGRNGTFVTDQRAISEIIGPLNLQGETTISAAQAMQLEKAMGLEAGSLANGFKVRQVQGIQNMSPRSPTQGNDLFGGQGSIFPAAGQSWLLTRSGPEIRLLYQL